MANIFGMVVSLMLALLALWLTPYFLSQYEVGSWQIFPIAVTGFFGGIAGVFLFLINASKVLEN